MQPETPSTLRSFTKSREVAKKYGSAGEYHSLIPVEQIFFHHESEGWVNGVYGKESEFLVMPKVPGGGGRGRQKFVPRELLEQMQKERYNWHAFD